MNYSFRLAARVLFYASSHRQDNTHHGLYCTSRGALAGMRTSMNDRSDDPTHHECYISLHEVWSLGNYVNERIAKRLLTPSTPRPQGIMEGRKEGNVLFNDALNTFYLRLYGVRHMVKNHSDSERGNSLSPHRLLFPISSKGSFICIIPQTG